ncbi:hypothetical protein MF672_020290 [Actinomadura sp. ATCC 31491]|uniref:Uncharacterized protein n=1 Tax=Actinomadura luzonensis TaxID=2805427 RepID=A0ABT0FVW1_9ACTN|nr:hypothetical protein [Actinomadura luzonensis]MCK2216120.1 hypothetical protein [Actinomadura luzonensis]
MRLTWKDALATVAAAADVAVYVVFTRGADVWFFNDVRGAAATILVLGLVGGCALSSLAEEFQGRTGYVAVASAIGALALIAGVVALVAASEFALAVLFWSTIALWLVATVRHAFMPGSKTPPARTEAYR